MGRYEIQGCNLDDTIRKSNVEWVKVKSAFTLAGARRKFWWLADNNHQRVIYRVFDTKTGKPIA